jgi:carbonic anhydrase
VKSRSFFSLFIKYFLFFRNGQKYSGEVHFVHTNEAQTQNAVLGIFMQTTPSPELIEDESSSRRKKRYRTKRDVNNTADNSTLVEWNNYFIAADNLTQTNDSIIVSLNLATLMGTNLNNFYRYLGSLTVPPCTENVIWTVFQTPITFNEPVLDSFRSNIFFEDYRGPQPVNGRTVYRNFPNSTPSSISDYDCCAQNQTTVVITNGTSNAYSILLINRQFLSYSYLFSLFFYSLM